MKNEIIRRLNLVLGALDNVSVSGKTNLANLSGSISIIEEVIKMIDAAELSLPEEDSERSDKK